MVSCLFRFESGTSGPNQGGQLREVGRGLPAGHGNLRLQVDTAGVVDADARRSGSFAGTARMRLRNERH